VFTSDAVVTQRLAKRAYHAKRADRAIYASIPKCMMVKNIRAEKRIFENLLLRTKAP
jgi:hypothetical protein